MTKFLLEQLMVSKVFKTFLLWNPNNLRRFHNKSWAISTHFPIKGKGKVVPLLNYAPRHVGVFGEWRYSSTHSSASALDGSEWSASRPGRFTLRERAPGTHWIGAWVGFTAGLDTVAKRKIPIPRQESNPVHPIVQPVGSRHLGSLCIINT
jgi:hypothetical protein